MTQHLMLNRSELTLPDGTPVESLRVGTLHNVLAALGIPDISSSMPKNELIAHYEAALIAKAEAMARAEHKKWDGPSDSILRRTAAALIEGRPS